MRERITALVRSVWKKIIHRERAPGGTDRRGGYDLLARMRERTTALVRSMWKKIIHRDDATDEEKKLLVEKIRNSPPISPMHAFLHPFMVVQAHRALTRYQARTWVWPRLMWFLMLVYSGFLLADYFSNRLAEPIPNEAFLILFEISVLPSLTILLVHILTTVVVRMEETCVWCHIIQRNFDGSIEATLLLSAYRLPFLDPSRDNPAPWQRTWWKSTATDVTLETKKDVTQLSLADIYDETVCSMRLPTTVPPSARRYVVGKVERHGDVTIREKRRLVLRFGWQTQTVVITAIGVIVSGVITLLATLLQS